MCYMKKFGKFIFIENLYKEFIALLLDEEKTFQKVRKFYF